MTRATNCSTSRMRSNFIYSLSDFGVELGSADGPLQEGPLQPSRTLAGNHFKVCKLMLEAYS